MRIFYLSTFSIGIAVAALTLRTTVYGQSPPVPYQGTYDACTIECPDTGPVDDCEYRCPSGGPTFTYSDCDIDSSGSTPGVDIDNWGLNYHHYVYDYAASSATQPSCSSCTSGGVLPASGISRLALSIQRRHRYRDQTWISSFGPGVYCNYDTKLKFYDTGGVADFVHLFHPEDKYFIRFTAPSGAVFTDSFNKAYRELRLVELVNNEYQNRPDASLSGADAAIVEAWDGTTYTFEIIDTQPAGGSSPEYHGRLIEIADRTGYKTTISYQDTALTNGNRDFDTGLPLDPADLLAADTNHQWLIHQVIDPFGRVATFHYRENGQQFAAKKSGRWVVRSIDLPNGQTVDYTYNGSFTATPPAPGPPYVNDGLLSKVDYASVQLATISYGTPTADDDNCFSADPHSHGGSLAITFVDGAAEGSQRTKTVRFSARRFRTAGHTGDADVDRGNAPYRTDAPGNKLYNHAAFYVRSVVNGTGEVSYMNIPYAWGSKSVFVYEGGGSARLISSSGLGNWLEDSDGGSPPATQLPSSRFYNDGYQVLDEAALLANPSRATSQLEEEYAEYGEAFGRGTQSNARRGIYAEQKDRHGRELDVIYDNNNTDPFAREKTYPDGTTERWDYNKYKQVTRHKDRLDRVTLYDYADGETGEDDNGNLWRREVGLYYNGTADVAPDVSVDPSEEGAHAVFFYQYHTTGSAGATLLYREYDATNDATLMAKAYPDVQPSAGAPAVLHDKYRQYTYNANSLLSQEERPNTTGVGLDVVYAYEYDPALRLKKVTDVEGGVKEYEYDERDRLTKTAYSTAPGCGCGDTTSEEFLYLEGNVNGVDATKPEDNLLIAQKDRNGNVTIYEYDDAGRREKTIRGAKAVGSGSILGWTASDVEDAVDNAGADAGYMTCEYLQGTDLEKSCVSNGDRVSYTYDYRLRRIETSLHPRQGVTLTSKTIYTDNHLVLAKEDRYGRRTFFAYRDSDHALIRKVVELVPGTVPGLETIEQGEDESVAFADIKALPRLTNGNPDYIITDYVLDAAGQQIATVDPRGVVSLMEYNKRGWVKKSIQAVGVDTSFTPGDSLPTVNAALRDTAITNYRYDAVGNQLRVETPRFNDTRSDPSKADCYVEMLYDERNALREQKIPFAAGAGGFIQERTFHDSLGRPHELEDFGGSLSRSYYSQCCGRPVGGSDQLGHGWILDHDGFGNVVHRSYVRNLSGYETNGTMYNSTARDSPNIDTLREITTRYDKRHRKVAETRWLTPLDEIMPDDPWITGPEAGRAATDALTTYWLYDDDLTDGAGLDNVSGVPVPSGGPNASIATVKSILAAGVETSTGNTPIVFDATDADGAAVVEVNAAGERRYKIYDGVARVVAAGFLDNSTVADPLTMQVMVHRDVAATTPPKLVATETVVVEDFGTGGVIDESSWTREERDKAGLVRARERELEAGVTGSDISNYEYDANGNQTKSRDANTVGWDGVYDWHNRLIKRTDTYGDALQTAYDKDGNVVLEVDAKHAGAVDVTATSFDPFSAVYQGVGYTTMSYDNRNLRLSINDRNGGLTTFTYTALGKVETVTDADANLANPPRPSTIYEHNVRGEVTSEAMPAHLPSSTTTDPGYDKCEYKIDAARRIVRRTDQLGETTQLIFDMADRLSRREYRTKILSVSHDTYGMLTDPPTDEDVFVNDELGRVEEATCDRYHNVCRAEYDSAGRKTLDSIQLLNAGYGIAGDPTYETRVEYDAASRIDKITYPDATVQTRSYTSRHSVDKLFYAGSEVEDRDYDVSGRLALRAAANGVDSTYSYRSSGTNQDNQLHTITRTGLSGADFTYTYDANKNRTELDISASAIAFSVTTADFGYTTPGLGYDDADRLLEWKRDGTVIPSHQKWTLTKSGDWQQFENNLNNEVRTHDAVHQITSQGRAYDGKGNLTNNGANTTFVWDFDNRLESATVASGGIGITGTHYYTYDAIGRRVSKQIEAASCPTRQRILYTCFGDQVMAEYGQACNGAGFHSPVLSSKYVYGSYIDEPVMQVEPSSGSEKKFYYHQDGLFNVIAITNQAGALVTRHGYEAYGWPVSFSSPSADVNGDGNVDLLDLDIVGTNFGLSPATLADGDVNGDGTVDLLDLDAIGQQFGSSTAITFSSAVTSNPYLFNGRRWDPEIGMYYYRARYHDPRLGRFLTRDPLGYLGGSTNTYTYVNAAPLQRRDPSGLFPSWFDELLGNPVRNPKRYSVAMFGDPHMGDPLDKNSRVWAARKVQEDGFVGIGCRTRAQCGRRLANVCDNCGCVERLEMSFHGAYWGWIAGPKRIAEKPTGGLREALKVNDLATALEFLAFDSQTLCYSDCTIIMHVCHVGENYQFVQRIADTTRCSIRTTVGRCRVLASGETRISKQTDPPETWSELYMIHAFGKQYDIKSHYRWVHPHSNSNLGYEGGHGLYW